MSRAEFVRESVQATELRPVVEALLAAIEAQRVDGYIAGMFADEMGWGNNPTSATAVATMVLVIGIFAAWLTLREAKAQRAALEAEQSARLRPWVGLYGLDLAGLSGSQAHVKILLRNFGTLPAQKAHLRVTVEPMKLKDAERPNPAVFNEEGNKILMPHEEGNYSLDLSGFPQFSEWISDRRSLTVKGAFSYASGNRTFESEFAGQLRFAASGSDADGPLDVKWRNVSAT